MPSRPPCGRSRCPADGCWAAGRRKSEQRTSLPPICALCLYLSLEPDPLHLVLRETLLGLAVEFGGACVRNSYKFSGNMLGRKNKIYTSACYRALGHIWLHGCVELLRDSDAADFFYAAQSCCTINIEARDNDSDKFSVPVLRQGMQENCNHVGPALRLYIGFRRNSPSRTCKSCFGGM